MLPQSLEAYRHIAALAAYPRYMGAFIFGSMARGDAGPASDVDVKVIVDQDNLCTNINHPHIDGRKLDITFLSLEQLRRGTEDEVARAERVPMLAESLIVFDKTGEIERLKARAMDARPKPLTNDDHQYIQFMVYHANSKVERHLEHDPVAALVVMHVSFTDILRVHYQIQQHWWLSDKRLLGDLRNWDAPLATLVERFVMTCDHQAKYALWSRIVDYILAPLGGRQPITENNCTCPVCREDLARLSEALP